ncbi:hypothetical protein PCK2_000691 [Pneumocystis canis]|nr:hypothetical protein PCK2_000691 [Pneumocystis canis]
MTLNQKNRSNREPPVIIDLVEDEIHHEPSKTCQVSTTDQNENSSQEKLARICCSICLDSPTDLSATPCGHLFCYSCILQAVSWTGAACPVCRQRISKQRILPLEVMLAPHKH